MRKISEITVKELIQYWINKQEEETGKKELCVIDLSSKHIKKCKDYYTKDIQNLMKIFFHVNFVNNSHTTEMFHFPEDKFENLYESIIVSVPQKTIKENNQHYDTASAYMKMKARKQFVNIVLKSLHLIDEDIEVSFEDYKFNEDWYYYSDYYDSQDWIEYDKFREPEEKTGLYDLNTKECDSLNPAGFINPTELRNLRNYILLFLYKRIIMQVPGATGAVSLYKNLMSKDNYTKDEVESVRSLNYKFDKFVNKYLVAKTEKELKNRDNYSKDEEELYNWLKEHNDYTLYVKAYKNKKNKHSKNKEYLRRSTQQAYIEEYHNAIGALYGYEIFEEDKSQELENFKRTKAGITEPIRAIFSRLLEDKMVSYKENLDWNKDEVDEFYISYSQEAAITEIDDCISSLDEIANMETL